MRISAALVTTSTLPLSFRHPLVPRVTRRCRVVCLSTPTTPRFQVNVERRSAHTLVNYHANDLGLSFEKVEIE